MKHTHTRTLKIQNTHTHTHTHAHTHTVKILLHKDIPYAIMWPTAILLRRKGKTTQLHTTSHRLHLCFSTNEYLPKPHLSLVLGTIPLNHLYCTPDKESDNPTPLQHSSNVNKNSCRLCNSAITSTQRDPKKVKW